MVGIPDREWGEKVAAFIVPKPHETVNPDTLKSFLKTRLSGFKVPKLFVTVNELPKSPAGKILKRDVKKEYVEGKIKKQ